MEKAIPIFYTEYGRYLSRFRQIPFYMDCLTPVYRRILLSLHEIASSTKTVKSAKIVGHIIGSYHPHGDSSAYGSLVSLYEQGFLDVQGNFGSMGLIDAKASAYRYTEAKIKKWVDDFCFQLIDYVEHDEYEYAVEPLFLPSPIPIGLVGNGGIYSGIAFHRTMVPRYKLSDLAKRLKWLIDKKGDEPIIYPTFEKDGCDVLKDDKDAKSILNTGTGTITVIPRGKIIGKKLYVYGRVPLNSFNSLQDDDRLYIKDLSKKTIEIEIESIKKQTDYKKFYQEIYNKYLIKNLNINMFMCDVNGTVKLMSVDEILLACYEYYVDANRYKLIDDCNRSLLKKFNNEIILRIRKILQDNPEIKTIDEIIKIVNKKQISITTEEFKDDKWIKINKIINADHIKEVCKRSIKSLIEYKILLTDNDLEINDNKTKLINNNKNCFQVIIDLIGCKI